MNTANNTHLKICIYWDGPGTYVPEITKGVKEWHKAVDGSNPVVGININSLEHAKQLTGSLLTNNIYILSNN